MHDGAEVSSDGRPNCQILGRPKSGPTIAFVARVVDPLPRQAHTQLPSH